MTCCQNISSVEKGAETSDLKKVRPLQLGIAFNYLKFIYAAQQEQKEILKKRRLSLEPCEWNNYN